MTPPSVMPACWWMLWMPKVADGSPQENPKELFPGEALEQLAPSTGMMVRKLKPPC